LTLNGLHRRYIPEDGTLHNHRCENLKSFCLPTSLHPSQFLFSHSLYSSFKVLGREIRFRAPPLPVTVTALKVALWSITCASGAIFRCAAILAVTAIGGGVPGHFYILLNDVMTLQTHTIPTRKQTIFIARKT
jgi:hypothetical protein